MNGNTIGCASSQQPAPPQVHEALSLLNSNIGYLTDTVEMLLRRLEPVTGAVAYNSYEGSVTSAERVPLAAVLDSVKDRVDSLVRNVEEAMRALQI